MRNKIQLAGCEDGNCPQIDQLSGGDFEIQGYTVADKTGTPAGHDRIRVPRDVLLSMIEQLQQRLAQQPA